MYKTNTTELKNMSNQLVELKDSAIPHFLALTPLKDWDVSLRNRFPKEHARLKLRVDLQVRDVGLYVVLVSDDKGFKADTSLVRAVIVNVSELAFFTSFGLRGNYQTIQNQLLKNPAKVRGEFAHFYAFDARTGTPIKGARVESQYDLNFKQQVNRLDGVTNASGMTSFTADIPLNKGLGNIGIVPWVYHEKNVAYTPFRQSLDIYKPRAVEMNFDTDRSIYRPGQTVKGRITIFRKTMGGYNLYEGRNGIQLTVNDSRGRAIIKRNIFPNKFGSSGFDFKIPDDAA
jgi:hypothetical protein